jgi:hypothetical protein
MSRTKAAVVIEHSDPAFCTKVNALFQKIVTSYEELASQSQRYREEKESYLRRLESVEQ